ncbi:MAG: universal stress protein [Chloroflexota bacterium]|nr:universal stress protein [Chloroflexota bacterium]
MKVLLAIDETPYSERAVQMLKALQLPPETEVTVMAVIAEHTYLGGITLSSLGSAAGKERAHKAQEQRALELLEKPMETLRASGLTTESLICWGRPASEIVKRARGMRADLVVIGAKGSGDPQRFPLGSVAQKVMKYADCSVLLVREKTNTIRRVLLATDGSKHSDKVTQFLLDLPLPKKSHVFVVTVLQSHIPALIRMPTMDYKANQRILSELQDAEENAAQALLAKSVAQFRERRYQVSSMVLKGDPAEEVMMAANTLNPEIVALGAKGLTEIENFLMGSVVQRVARFSPYSVLIGR